MGMRKVIFAVFIILVGFCGTCFGRELVNPDTLTFRKTYSMPGMSRDEIREFVKGWPPKNAGLEYSRSSLDWTTKSYRGRYFDVLFGKTRGDLFGDVILVFRDGGFDLVFKNISAQWRNSFVTCMSTNDDNLNRTWFWRAGRSKKILGQIRERSKELFDMITASMDDYLKAGPPVELKKL